MASLFGITAYGAVFEIAKTSATATGYASAPTILATLEPGDGTPSRSTNLNVDANGDLFGTTSSGGTHNGGTVFEIINTPSGYEKTPRVVISFNPVVGGDPQTTLIPTSKGDLLGETSGPGTVFKITDSGFVTSPTPPGVPGDLVFQNTDGQAAIWSLTGTDVTDGGAVSPNPGPGWKAGGDGRLQRRRSCRHSVAERQHGPSLDLGHGREQP